jgi:hypothetical protein
MFAATIPPNKKSDLLSRRTMLITVLATQRLFQAYGVFAHHAAFTRLNFRFLRH